VLAIFDYSFNNRFSKWHFAKWLQVDSRLGSEQKVNYSLRFGILLIVIGSIGIGNYLQPRAVAIPSNNLPAEIVPVDTNMHDLMEGMFQAPYRRLKEAMANEPKDNNGWKAIRSDVLILAEGSNFLVLRKQETEQAKWDEYSLASKLSGETAFKAAKQKNFAETRKAYEAMLIHCNDCHKTFAKGKHQLVP
jgi:hypothetical protein